MKRKKYIKHLMAVGISRNTAAEAAAAAARGGTTLYKSLGYLLNLRGIFAYGGRTPADFERAVLVAARMTPVRVRPLRIKRRRHCDGLRVQYMVIDELSHWPKENPHLGGGGND